MRFALQDFDVTVTVQGRHGNIHLLAASRAQSQRSDHLLPILEAVERRLNRKIISFTPERGTISRNSSDHITNCWFTLDTALLPTECEIDEPARR